ncbi:MAG: 2-hydroxychromene-2-carboxylate isomerase [Polaromonas sp.]|uniref:2-hydroxychromene-2-carboxylate isomerase n=1 Tax=Polaromonas sp. TaxID=1869339 RepID=UPI00185979B4|nr:2-hydroxychromene-2-carboxylate isomerase [Polaromonas sp.]MBA3595283.1 2-hydroxychromene-2-carboxylate isomerase [Polaromonas sp.]
MNAPVQFLFDFGSPNAYLCHKVLPEMERRTGIAVQYVPILLGGLFKLSNNRSPAVTTADIANKRAYNALEMKRFISKHQITKFKFNSFFPVNTLPIMRGAVAAQEIGCFAPYVDVMFAAMWEQVRNLNEMAEILAVLQDAGLDAKRLLEGVQSADVKEKLMANTQSAFERGAFGSPTFFVGNEMYFGKDRLVELEQEIIKQSALS